MTPDEFLARCPRLWHVAPAGAWEQITAHGFRTAAQLIAAADLDEASRRKLIDEPRREHVELRALGGTVSLRDQGPLFARKDLTTILGDGLTTADWIQLLNSRLYLFSVQAPMRKLIDKYVALDGAQDVIELSTESVLAAAGDRLELAAQNTGAIARRTGVQKDRSTFMPLADFPNQRPMEVTVVDGLDDLSVVVGAHRHHRDSTIEELDTIPQVPQPAPIDPPELAVPGVAAGRPSRRRFWRRTR